MTEVETEGRVEGEFMSNGINSNLTASMRAELEATVRDVASMREVIALKKVSGHDPSPEALQAVAATDARIAELRASIGDRLQATEIADAEATPATATQ